ncbi:hypothetical protein PLESTF_000472200 [Pleodorina starrii]|nr:hypothetical protein PLESTM_001766800 [Pleodorina starrii]GLC66766.1 hypothetical protein PLESTF_000472200 [Pleodorina starrii]
MDTNVERYNRHLAHVQTAAWNGGQLGIDGLHLSEQAFQRGSTGPDWTSVPEGVLLHISRFLDHQTTSNARSVCRSWRRAFSLNVHTARLEIGEHRAAQARAFLRAFVRAFPSTAELVLDITFRRTAREKIQAALEEHFQALQDFGFQALQLNLDLNSFNERKIKLLDVSLLASWSGLSRLTLQESGWRSQQLRVDAPTVFSSLPALQELSVVCKYSGQVKAKWWRPPSPAERLAARMPTWPPQPQPPGAAAGAAAAGAAAAAAAAAAARGMEPPWGAPLGLLATGGGGGGDAAMEDALPLHPQAQAQAQQQLLLRSSGAGAGVGAGCVRLMDGGKGPAARPVLTQHLRCQMTQNQSMSGELQKALKRITPSLQPHVTALTFEIVEETYAEPARCATPLELSALPGLKSLTVLSGAEDALTHSKLDLVGATGLESLVLFDVSCGCWCYKKPGHGIPPRLLSAPPAFLRSLTVVGFVVNQCQNLHALSSLSCLEELRLEQPDPDCLAAVAGELLLTWLPTSLTTLKLHSVVLPPCGVPAMAALEGEAPPPPQAAAPQAPPPYGLAAAPPPPGGGGGGAAGSAAAAAASSGSSSSSLMYRCVAPVAPLPQLRELYLSKCKVPTLGVLGVCSQLTSLGVINCLSCSGMLPAPAAMPALRSLAVIYTLTPEQEHGAGGMSMPGMPMSNMPPPAFAAGLAAAGGGPADGLTLHGGGGAGGAGLMAAARVYGGGGCAAAAAFGGGGGSAAAAAALHQWPTAALLPQPPPLHISGLPLPPVVWGSDEQVAAVAACRTVTSLELILPRGSAGFPAVVALAAMPALGELEVALPCGLSECMMGLARLGGSSGGRLRRLTLWVDGRTCVNRNRARQLQAIQRSLQVHMGPDTQVEWAGAESRQGSWTGLEARVFNPH